MQFNKVLYYTEVIHISYCSLSLTPGDNSGEKVRNCLDLLSTGFRLSTNSVFTHLSMHCNQGCQIQKIKTQGKNAKLKTK